VRKAFGAPGHASGARVTSAQAVYEGERESERRRIVSVWILHMCGVDDGGFAATHHSGSPAAAPENALAPPYRQV